MTSAEHPPAVVEQPVLDDLRARLPRRPDRRLGRLLRLAVGYERYVVSAGDVGCDVAEALAAGHPDRVAALHLTDVSQYRFLVSPPQDLSDAERAYIRHGHHWQATEGGYMHEQSTKPHTLAAGLGDSPAGLLAWILEKLRSWTDCGGDVETVFSRDELLTWITAYWVSGAIDVRSWTEASGGGHFAAWDEVFRAAGGR